MVSIVRYPVQRVVNWYEGNFCARKCFNKEGRMFDCHNKFQAIVDKNRGLLITHKEFKDLVDNGDIKICKLKCNFRRRTVGWKQLEQWSRDYSFNPDKFD